MAFSTKELRKFAANFSAKEILSWPQKVKDRFDFIIATGKDPRDSDFNEQFAEFISCRDKNFKENWFSSLDKIRDLKGQEQNAFLVKALREALFELATVRALKIPEGKAIIDQCLQEGFDSGVKATSTHLHNPISLLLQ